MDYQFSKAITVYNNRVLVPISILMVLLSILHIVPYLLEVGIFDFEPESFLYIYTAMGLSGSIYLIYNIVKADLVSINIQRIVNYVFITIYISFPTYLSIVDLFNQQNYTVYAVSIVVFSAIIRERLSYLILVIMCQFTATAIFILHTFSTNSMYLLLFECLVFSLIAVFTAIMQARNFRIRFTSERKLLKTNEELHQTLHSLHRSQDSMKRDFAAAKRIQKKYLTQKPPHVNGWDIAFYFKPAMDVSGDFYDFYTNDKTLEGISLFDVSGHGISSALVSMLAKRVIFQCFSRNKDLPLKEIATIINHELQEEVSKVELFLAGIILRIDKNQIEYVNAGHTDLLFKKAKNSKVDTIIHSSKQRNSFIASNSDTVEFKDFTFTVEKGDLFFIFTDGFYELPSKDGPYLEHSTLHPLFKSIPLEYSAHKTLDTLIQKTLSLAAVDSFQDDCTAIVLKKL